MQVNRAYKLELSPSNKQRTDLFKFAGTFRWADNCGISIDRDVNAALNLKKYGEMYAKDPTVAASWAETLNACGDYVRPSDG